MASLSFHSTINGSSAVFIVMLALTMTACKVRNPITQSTDKSTSAESNAQLSVTLGSYKIETKTEIAPDGSETILIAYSPYESYQHAKWGYSHLEMCTPITGIWPGWANAPISSDPQTLSRSVLAKWHDQPDLMAADHFSVSLSTTSAQGWSRLLAADEMVLDYLIRKNLGAFLKKNKEILKKLQLSVDKTLGPLIAYPQFHSVSKAKRDQFILGDLVNFAQNNRSDFLGPFPKYDEYYKTANGIQAIEPRIPKLVDVPAKLTNHSLIVVHATRVFDEDAMAKDGIDSTVKLFKSRQLPVIYLMTDTGEGDLGWYTEDRKPDYALLSEGGEHNLQAVGDEYTLAGGFFGDYGGNHGCQFLALTHLITRHDLHSLRPLLIHFPVNATYFYEDEITLRNDFLANKISSKDFITRIEGLLFPDDPEIFGPSSRLDELSLKLKDYTIEFWVDGKLVPETTKGTGDRRVILSFER